MLTIHLQQCHFRSHHGVYEEERILGGDYIVDLEVKYLPKVEVVKALQETLNYEQLFKLVQERMMQPTPLLETIVMEIAHKILNNYLDVREVSIKIEKCNPPIPGLKGSVAVSYEQHR